MYGCASGPLLEQKYGSIPLLVMCTVTAATTGLLSVVVFRVGLLGASGIVFLFIMMSSFANVRTKRVPITSVAVAVLYLGNEVYLGLFQDQVSQFAHIFGGMCGAVFGYVASAYPHLLRPAVAR